MSKLLKILILFLLTSCSNKNNDILLDTSNSVYDYLETPFDKGLTYYGVSEIRGTASNNVITDFFRTMKYTYLDEETPWCSAFMNSMAIKTGYEFSNSLSARSWLKVGNAIDHPRPGDVIILWRESADSWKGHVGFFINYSPDLKTIYVFGGNQLNKVQITEYDSERLLGFRRLNRRDMDYANLEISEELRPYINIE